MHARLVRLYCVQLTMSERETRENHMITTRVSRWLRRWLTSGARADFELGDPSARSIPHDGSNARWSRTTTRSRVRPGQQGDEASTPTIGAGTPVLVLAEQWISHHRSLTVLFQHVIESSIATACSVVFLSRASIRKAFNPSGLTRVRMALRDSPISSDLRRAPFGISMPEHIALRVVGCLIAEFKIQIFQVNLAALFSKHSRVKAPRLFWANLYEIPNRIRA